MKRVKVRFAETGSGNTTALMVIPKEFIEKMDLNENERIIEVECVNGQIIIKKAVEQSGSKKCKRQEDTDKKNSGL